uniref:Growth hormone secretagogue receptor type 1 n=1 Tax=Cynoglossus semilaevis TaxID=244447 RepID=A0A3P8WHV2_CYNSE
MILLILTNVCDSDLHSTDAVWKPKKPFSSVVCVTVIYIPLMLFGLLGNILTILVVWLRPHMRSSTYLYLSSMAVSDLLILLLLPLDLYKLWRPRPWLLGDLTCKLTMFLSECCTFCTILHITFLSLERYVAVCWPITAKTTVTRRRTRALIGCLWLGAAISAAPVLVMVGVEENGIKELCRCTDYAVSSGLLAAMMILSNLYFLVPVFILGLVYSLIGRTLWIRQRRSRKDQTHRHTIKMLGVIVLAFVLCWLPFHVGRTIFSLSLDSDAHYFNLVSSVLYYLSAAVNPLLYNMMSTRYRHAVHSLVHANCNTQPRRAHTTVTAQNSTTPV